MTWQNQQNGCVPSKDSDQPGHLPSLIRVFAVHMKKAWVLSYPLSAQRRLWSDWADAQADLSLRWEHTHFVCFVMSRLIYGLMFLIIGLPRQQQDPCAKDWPSQVPHVVFQPRQDQSSVTDMSGRRHHDTVPYSRDGSVMMGPYSQWCMLDRAENQMVSCCGRRGGWDKW